MTLPAPRSSATPPSSARPFTTTPAVQWEPHFDGIGLGLSIVRKLVQSHHGIVDVRSDGRLVVFRITLPVPYTATGNGVHDTAPAAHPVQAAAR
ncbi:MAG: hypothetical protein ACRD0K_13770 [Egibacteraceae bacterium]